MDKRFMILTLQSAAVIMSHLPGTEHLIDDCLTLAEDLEEERRTKAKHEHSNHGL